jgi:hypothetical protein
MKVQIISINVAVRRLNVAPAKSLDNVTEFTAKVKRCLDAVTTARIGAIFYL